MTMIDVVTDEKQTTCICYWWEDMSVTANFEYMLTPKSIIPLLVFTQLKCLLWVTKHIADCVEKQHRWHREMINTVSVHQHQNGGTHFGTFIQGNNIQQLT